MDKFIKQEKISKMIKLKIKFHTIDFKISELNIKVRDFV